MGTPRPSEPGQRPDGAPAPGREWTREDWERELPPGRGAPDLAPLLALLDAARGAVPRELQDQLNAVVRELLLALRAVIDWYLERLDDPPPEPQVEDIPID